MAHVEVMADLQFQVQQLLPFTINEIQIYRAIPICPVRLNACEWCHLFVYGH